VNDNTYINLSLTYLSMSMSDITIYSRSAKVEMYQRSSI